MQLNQSFGSVFLLNNLGFGSSKVLELMDPSQANIWCNTQPNSLLTVRMPHKAVNIEEDHFSLAIISTAPNSLPPIMPIISYALYRH